MEKFVHIMKLAEADALILSVANQVGENIADSLKSISNQLADIADQLEGED